MPLSDYLRFGAQMLPGGFELIILLIIIAVLLLFGPKKLPELARSIGRAWGELRRGKMEVERQIRDEFTAEERRDVGSRLRDAARELGVDPASMQDSDLKLQIVRRIDPASDDKVASVARILGVSESGAGPSRLRELIVKSLGI
jgi:sec-independent protein translocase protein TatA